MKRTRTLVTGGAGGIGLHVVSRLATNGHAVDVLDDFSAGTRDKALSRLQAEHDVRVLEHDLTVLDPGALAAERYKRVYHLAAQVGVTRTLEHPFDVLSSNAAMTLTALELARRTGAQRFVFASSSEVYNGSLLAGNLPLPTPETAHIVMPDLDEPRSAYLLSKLYGEALSRHGSVPWTILRYHNVYGPRMGHAHVIPQLVERALSTPERGQLPVHSLEHRRTFCHITDAVEITVRAGEEPRCEGEILNVGADGPEIRIGDLAESIVALLHLDIDVVAAPDTPGSPTRRQPDMTKTERLTGYRGRVALDEGLAATVAWYREHIMADA